MAGCRLDLSRVGTSIAVTERESETADDLMTASKRAVDPASKRIFGKRWLTLAVAAGSGLVFALAGGGVLASKASAINTELQQAARLLPELKTQVLKDDAASAKKTIDALKAHTTKARQMANDPMWTLAEALPWLGANFSAVSEVTTSADDVVQLAAEPMVGFLQTVDWKTLTPSSRGVDLTPLTAAVPKLVSAAHAVAQSSARLDAIDADTLLPQVAQPLGETRDRLRSFRSGLDSAADAASVAPSMMGAQEARRYLVLIQNNAEVRASGGIPGALAVLSLDNGKLTLGPQSSASDLGKFVPAVPVDPAQELIYTKRLGLYMQDVNLTPDFPTTASLAKSMWERKKGESVDGVISIDPVALSYLLNATGAVRLTDPQILELAAGGLPTQLTANNVVPTLLSDVYAKIPAPAMQDAYFAGVAQKVFEAFSSDEIDPQKLLDGLTRGVNEGRVLVWSGDKKEQAIISDYQVGGSISGPSVSPTQFGVYFNDGTGAKMDYYVRRRVKLIEECTSDEYAKVKVHITSTNTAPADASSALPEYVTGGGILGVRAGTVQTNITAYGPVQSNVETAVINGTKTPFSAQQHNGRPVGTVTVSLAPGQSATVEMTFDQIVQHAAPSLVVTPTVESVKDVVLAAQSAECDPPK